MHVLAALGLLLVTVGWFLLALVPALGEHFGRTDVGALRVASAAADIRFFAISFQHFVDDRIAALRANSATPRPHVATLTDGTGVWYAPQLADARGMVTVFEGASEEAVANGLVVISETGVRVPSEVQVLKELYTSKWVAGDRGCVFRAVLAGGDAELGPNSEVLRWVNAGGGLRVGRDSTLWGRASSWGTMSLAQGTRFQRLAAPRIELGWLRHVPERDTRERVPMTPPNNAAVFSSRWVVDGDLDVPGGERVDADVIVSGRLTVGRGALIAGAVRCSVLAAAEDAIFSRSVVGTTALAFSARCHVAGPVVAEGEVVFGDGCRVGEAGKETTITAISLKVGNSVVMCGEIWARRQGVVCPLPGPLALAPAAA